MWNLTVKLSGVRRPTRLEMTRTHHPVIARRSHPGSCESATGDVCATFTLRQRRVRLMRRSDRMEAAWELQMAHYYWQQWVLSPARLKVTLVDISKSALHPQVSPETDYNGVHYKHGEEWNVNILASISTLIVQVVIVTMYRQQNCEYAIKCLGLYSDSRCPSVIYSHNNCNTSTSFLLQKVLNKLNIKYLST